MDFNIKIKNNKMDGPYFYNSDSLNFYYYLTEKGLDNSVFTLKTCTKWENRINIEIMLNNFKIIICPNKTMYNWFSVSKQHISDNIDLDGNDAHEFSCDPEHFNLLYDFILEN